MSKEYHPYVNIRVIAAPGNMYGCGYCSFKCDVFMTMAAHYRDKHLDQDKQLAQGLINYRKIKEIAIAKGLANKVRD